MKVLHLLNTDRFSGAENVVCQIIGMMKDIPSLEMIYCSREGLIRGVLEEQKITFVPIRNLTCRELKRIVREEKPDLIHAHDMKAGFVAALVCGKIPLISHIHNNAFNSRRISLKSIAYIYAAIKAKHVFWVSQSSFDGYAFHKAFKKKSSVLYNIIDIEVLRQKMSLDKNTYDYDLVYIGRLTYPKNPQRLMNVMRMVKKNLPNIKIAVIGTGELEEETKKLAREYDLLANISFLGFQSNPLKILHDSKMMVMTSRWEGTPMCALEAMALGVPIVSTPVDGLKKLVKNGENGFLSSDDSILAQHICAVLNNEKLYSNLSSNQIKKSIALNDLQKYRDTMISIYRSC